MRHISFSMTTPQILDRSKTVTRRVGWTFLKPGELLQAIEKGQGLKKGEHVRKLAVLRVESVRREVLCNISDADIKREGFGEMSNTDFVEMFLRSHPGSKGDGPVTRIEFSYVEAAA